MSLLCPNVVLLFAPSEKGRISPNETSYRVIYDLYPDICRMGLVVNENKTKYLLSKDLKDYETTSLSAPLRGNERLCVYGIQHKYQQQRQILNLIAFANRCYDELNRHLKTFRKSKITLYKSLIIPVLLCDAEAWTWQTAMSIRSGEIFSEGFLSPYAWVLQRYRHSAVHKNTAAALARPCCPNRRKHSIPQNVWLAASWCLTKKKTTQWKDQVNADLAWNSNWRSHMQCRNDWWTLIDTAKFDTRL